MRGVVVERLGACARRQFVRRSYRTCVFKRTTYVVYDGAPCELVQSCNGRPFPAHQLVVFTGGSKIGVQLVPATFPPPRLITQARSH